MYLYLNIHRNKIDVYMSLCQIIDSVQVYSDWYVFVWFYLRFIYTSIYSFILVRNYIFRTIIRLAQLWFCLWHWGLLNPILFMTMRHCLTILHVVLWWMGYFYDPRSKYQSYCFGSTCLSFYLSILISAQKLQHCL